MLSRRSFQLLSAGERQALWRQARRQGQCVRCFHASLQRAADDHELAGAGASREETQQKTSPKANVVEKVQARPGPPDSFHSASPHQPSKPESTKDRRRHQRSAMISEEVQMVSRDHPSPTFADANPNTSRQQPPPTAQTPNPQGSAMGQNDPVSREGPMGQGVGTAVATDEDVPDTSGLARGARSPQEGVEEPMAGGAGLVGAMGEGRQTAPLMGEAPGLAGEEAVTQSRRRARPAGTAMEPSQTLAKDDLLNAGYETFTPTRGTMHSNILDHLRMSAHPAEPPQSSRSPQQLAAKMMDGQLVHFHSQSEKAATEELARQIAERRAKNYARQQKLSADEAQPEAEQYHFAPVSESARKGITDRLARGVYDAEGLLNGQASPKYKAQPLLNALAQQALKNSTYTTRDGERFLRKVQSLLPRAAPAGAQGRGQQQQQQQKQQKQRASAKAA